MNDIASLREQYYKLCEEERAIEGKKDVLTNAITDAIFKEISENPQMLQQISFCIGINRNGSTYLDIIDKGEAFEKLIGLYPRWDHHFRAKIDDNVYLFGNDGEYGVAAEDGTLEKLVEFAIKFKLNVIQDKYNTPESCAGNLKDAQKAYDTSVMCQQAVEKIRSAIDERLKV